MDRRHRLIVEMLKHKTAEEVERLLRQAADGAQNMDGLDLPTDEWRPRAGWRHADELPPAPIRRRTAHERRMAMWWLLALAAVAGVVVLIFAPAAIALTRGWPA